MGREGANGKINMAWWKGVTVVNAKGDKVECHTLLDCLENFVIPPDRTDDGAMRVPLSGVYKIKGVGDVPTGCVGKVFTVEMHHKNVDAAHQGDKTDTTISR